MNTQRLFAATAAALVTCVTLGCKDIPLLPKWDASWNLPLPSQVIKLQNAFPAGIPVTPFSGNVSFTAPQSEPIDGFIGQVLGDSIGTASIAMVLTKSIPLSGSDTLFVAATVADLSNPAAQRIVMPLTMIAANAQDSILTPLTAGGLAMLQGVAKNNGTLQVQLSGRVTYSGPAPRAVTSTDSIGVKLALLATVSISR